MLDILEENIICNPKTSDLYEAISLDNRNVQNQVFVDSGEKTGRCAQDKYIICTESQREGLWWRDEQKYLSPQNYEEILDEVLQNLEQEQQIFCIDGYLGNHSKNRLHIRCYTYSAERALFLRIMLVNGEFEQDQNPDYTLYDAGKYSLQGEYQGLSSATCIALSLLHKSMCIIGTEYLGELKKVLFTLGNYWYPYHGMLSMHCAANQGEQGDVSLFFGLSGTGKTTLSLSEDRKLIGDDEIIWGKDGIWNLEGGCYAKCNGLSSEIHPLIFDAVQRDVVFENISQVNGQPDFDDCTKTENTRVAYDLHNINSEVRSKPYVTNRPKNIFFLSHDAYGVLPAIAQIPLEFVKKWFIAGYTSKVAGTEQGVAGAEITCSACFGEPFLVFKPELYANLLDIYMKQADVCVWLVNTGYIGAGDTRSRVDLSSTQLCIQTIHNNEDIQLYYDKHLGLLVPKKIDGLKNSLLKPSMLWENQEEYRGVLDILIKKIGL